MRPRLKAPVAALAWALCLDASAAASAAPIDPDEARPLVDQLVSDLASQPSATQVLTRWCEDRRLGDPPVITAKRQVGHDKAATAEVRKLLHASADEPVRYRRVELACGRRVLSRADNWYRADRLTPAMNSELDGTDHPFGAVVESLNFHRETLDSKVLMAADADKVPASILRNKALLETPEGEPFSLVIETYARTLLSEGGQGRAERFPTGVRIRAVRVVTYERIRAPRLHIRERYSRDSHPRTHAFAPHVPRTSIRSHSVRRAR